MRILGLVVALLVTISMSAAAQTHVRGYTRKDGTYVQGHWRSSPDDSSYKNYTGKTATGDPDPYLQRYYSHSEGWTYYNLPSYSTARKNDDK